MVETVRDSAIWIAAIAAGLAALGYVFRLVRSLFRRIITIQRLVEAELTHNHGSSMKDDVYGLAVSLGTIQRTLAAHDRRLAYLENPRKGR